MDKTNVGIWVDHREARLVFLQGDSVRTVVLGSGLQRGSRHTGGRMGGAPFGRAGHVSYISQHRIERHRDRQLLHFYRGIVELLKGAGGLVLLGPGEAKLELEKELRRHPQLHKRLLAVLSSTRLTSRQLTVRVRDCFSENPVERRSHVGGTGLSRAGGHAAA